MREIEFYRTRSGRSPVGEFLQDLSSKATAKIKWVLDQVSRAEPVSTEYLKKLRGTEDLWEIRVQQGGIAYRLLGFFDGPRLIVVVTAFSKKVQRVPLLEIAVAHQRRRDYLDRKRPDERP